MARRIRDILIAPVGLTPQVVTETLWALYHRKPSIRISEVWVLTTAEGQKACLEKLLDPKTGQFHAFLKEYRIRPGAIRFGCEQIQVLKDATGRPLQDIRTDEDSRAVADQVAELVRSQAERPDVRLHGSVAGGRKTMGIYLAFAFQLYGREQDRLYHVLVNEPFESNPEFFYKPHRPRMIVGLSGQRLSTKDARIELTEIPFLRIRHKLGPLQNQTGYSGQVQQAQRELNQLIAQYPLVINLSRRVLQIGEVKVPLSAKRIALYTYFAKTGRFQRLKDVVADGWVKICEYWKKAGGKDVESKKEKIPLASEIWPEITRINQSIQKVIGDPVLASFYMISSETGHRQYDGYYGLKLDPKKIAIQEATG